MKIEYGDGVEDALDAALKALKGYVVALIPAGAGEVDLTGECPYDLEIVTVGSTNVHGYRTNVNSERISDLVKVPLAGIDRIHVY